MSQYLAPSQFLASGFDLPAPPNGKSTILAHAAPCAICGMQLMGGADAYLTQSLITVTTAEIADTFRHSSEAVCAGCARCFGASRTLTGAFFVTDSYAMRPMVALASATPERPAWRDWIRSVPQDTPNVSILTLNTKRRLWTRAVVSAFGACWQPLFVDGEVDRLLRVNVPRMLACLDLVEQIYALGFTKSAIATTLYESLTLKRLEVTPLNQIAVLDAAMQPWRGTDELIAALFIAQKPIEGGISL